MFTLVQNEPGLFLDKICKRVFDKTALLACTKTIKNVLWNKIGITWKKASSVNACKDLVQKYQFIRDMSPFPAKFLVLTDKSAICSRDLLCNYSCSPKGLPAHKYQFNNNPQRFSLVLAISVCGLIAAKFFEENVSCQNFEHF